MILSAQSIRRLCTYTIPEFNMLTPFSERTVFEGMSYGLSSAGYDIRLAQDIIIYPWGFALGSSMEHFNMPDNLIGIVHSKSSWARLGVSVDNTVIEPGWKGYLTLELSNHLDERIVITKGHPIAQIIFHQLDLPTDAPYRGKYQNQENHPVSVKYET